MIQNVIVSANPTSVVAQQANSDGPLIELFIRRKRSHAIQRTHQIAVDQFMQFMNYKSLATVSLVDMVEYTEHLEAAYKSKYTQRLKLAAARALLAFGQKVSYLQFYVGADD